MARLLTIQKEIKTVVIMGTIDVADDIAMMVSVIVRHPAHQNVVDIIVAEEVRTEDLVHLNACIINQTVHTTISLNAKVDISSHAGFPIAKLVVHQITNQRS